MKTAMVEGSTSGCRSRKDPGTSTPECVSSMTDDYYRFVDRAHILRGENTGKVYRLGDRVRVQVIKVDMERRQVDLGLSEVLEAVRVSEANRGPRRSRAEPKREVRARQAAKSGKRKGRPGKRERTARRR